MGGSVSIHFDSKQLKEYLKINEVSMVFECIDPIHDPHIIEYSNQEIILLDIIKNNIEFQKIPYEDLCEVSKTFNFKVKELTHKIKNFNQFSEWYYTVTAPEYVLNDEYIEGFVCEDSYGYMVKIKTSYYKFWKHMRRILERVNAGKKCRFNLKTDSREYNFYMFLQSELEEGRRYKDIIEARKYFLLK